MKNQITFLPVFALVLGLSGCGTMIDKSVQKVEVQTPGIDQVGCEIQNDKYKYSLLAPGTIMLERSHIELNMICSKRDYKTVEVTLPVSVNPSSYWNALNGVIPGTAYDIGARGAYKFPDIVVVEMHSLVEPETEVTVMPVVLDDSEVTILEEIMVMEPERPQELYRPSDNYSPADDMIEDSLTGRK